ncbi:hypothetical protein IPM65_07015 [Candidatus Roizmanbacteria bacterium]|nr:MAG: hypothetical protein IPM65_07015 [Candidatus Roizmanbacteria bacterium]
MVNKATAIGTVPLNFINDTSSDWDKFLTEDIIEKGYITTPPDYICTLGSGICTAMTSLATTPAYPLPTTTQSYYAGRDVLRWGGFKDPHEVDFDRYGFTPDFNKGVAILWKAPKSEPHHLSKVPDILDYLSDSDRDFCKAILEKKLP